MYQKCPSDIFIPFCHGAPAALGALRFLRTRVATAYFAVPFTTAMRRSSVADTDRPRRGLPRPNCHSIAFFPPSL